MKNVTRLLAALVVTLVLLTLILAAPILLGLAYTGAPADWSRLSDIGQAYGGISAALSALALLGIVATFWQQQRQVAEQLEQTRIARTGLTRSLHWQLLELAMKEPEIYGPIFLGDAYRSPDQARRRIYTQLWFIYGMVTFEPGDPETEPFFEQLFQHEGTREFWERARSAWGGDPDDPFFVMVKGIGERVRSQPPVTRPAPAPGYL